MIIFAADYPINIVKFTKTPTTMKTRHFILAVLALLCSATMLTACGSDDDDNGSSEDVNKPVAGVMNLKMSVSDQMLNALDMSIEYYDAAGILQTEQVTTKDLEKNVKTKLPAKLGVRVKVRVKANVETANLESVALDYAIRADIYAVNAAGTILEGGKSVIRNGHELKKGNELQNWVSKYPNGFVDLFCTVGTDGKAVVAE